MDLKNSYRELFRDLGGSGFVTATLKGVKALS